MSSLLKCRYTKKPYAALDALLRLIAEYDLRLLMLSTSTVGMRQQMGELVARLLINTAVAYDVAKNKTIQSGPTMPGMSFSPDDGDSNVWEHVRPA